jgi:hypothetical protein
MKPRRNEKRQELSEQQTSEPATIWPLVTRRRRCLHHRFFTHHVPIPGPHLSQPLQRPPKVARLVVRDARKVLVEAGGKLEVGKPGAGCVCVRAMA